MQINTSMCRGCTHNQGGLVEEKNSPVMKSGKENSQRAPSRPRKLGKLRSTKVKTHNTYYRLDHTYAAASSINSIVQLNQVENRTSNTSGVNHEFDDGGINSKNSWLRNLCLEYQPRKDYSKTKVKNDTAQKESSYQFSGINGTLKQYHRNRKVSRNKSDFSRKQVEVNEVIPEDQKRWTAALALLELQNS